MRKVMVLLLFAAIGVIGLSTYISVANGQEKEAASAKQMRWDGHIARVDAEHSFMDVRDAHGVVKRIHWDNATTWTKLNKPVTDHSDFKVEERVICLGKPGEKGAFLATRIDLRVHP